MEGEETKKKIVLKKNPEELNEESECNKRLTLVLLEIQERQDWLIEMEELGKDANYRSQILFEIQSRIHRLKQLYKSNQETNKNENCLY
jgi:hypothetical protein